MENIWQILNWKFSIVFGFIAAIIALFQAIFNTVNNRKKLRWEKAKLSYEMVEQVYDLEPAYNALRMIDKYVEYFSKDGIKITISEIKRALTTNDMSQTSQDIRECFDSLFYCFQRLEHSIEIGIIKLKDIESHFKYYAGLLKEDNVFINYANQIHYTKVEKFLNDLK